MKYRSHHRDAHTTTNCVPKRTGKLRANRSDGRDLPVPCLLLLEVRCVRNVHYGITFGHDSVTGLIRSRPISSVLSGNTAMLSKYFTHINSPRSAVYKFKTVIIGKSALHNLSVCRRRKLQHML